MLGQQVYKVLDSNLNAGNHKVQFNASSLSTGVYIYKIEAKNYTATRNMILIK